MDHVIRFWLVMLALHLPAYFFWGWLLFRSWADFWDALVCWLKLDFWYWDWDDDDDWDNLYALAKLAAWFFAPLGLIWLEIRLLGL